MSQYVLRERLASKTRGKPIYFKMMTRIGPCNTDDVREAHKFDSAEAARQSPAFYHSLSFYEVEPAP